MAGAVRARLPGQALSDGDRLRRVEPSRAVASLRRCAPPGAGATRQRRSRGDDDRGLRRPLEHGSRATRPPHAARPGGPTDSGVFARFVGHQEAPARTARTSAGEPAGSIGKGGGLVAALRPGDGPPTWVVTGTDAKGVAAAANLLGADAPRPLRGRDPARRAGDRGARTVRPALAYTPGRSPLHRASPGAAIAYLGSLAAIAFVYLEPDRPGRPPGSPPCWPGSRGRRPSRGARLAAAGAVAARADGGVVNALVTHRGRHGPGPRLGGAGARPHRRHARVARRRARSLGLRVVVVVLVFAVYSACVDPDRVLRALRPLARRSALTATLVTRMVPLAAADGARLREAAALRGPGRGAGRAGARSRGGSSRARSTARSTSRRRSSCAATRCRLRRACPARERLARTTPALLRDRRCARRSSPWSPAIAGVGELRRLPGDRDRRRRRPRSRSAALRARPRAAAPFARAEVALAWLTPRPAHASGLSYRYPGGRPRDALREIDLRGRAGRVRRPRRAAPARASRPCCAPPAASCRTSTAARSRASSRSPGSTSARTARRSSPRWSGSSPRSPRPRSSRPRSRAEIELPLELRGELAGRPGAGGRGGGAGPRDRRAARAHRPTRSPAASCSGSRSPPRWSPARAWSCSTSRPRSSTRSPATS